MAVKRSYSQQQDSGRQTAVYGIAMILTSSMLTSCLTAPMSSNNNNQQDSMGPDPWWYNSCDHYSHQPRHVSMKKLKTTTCSSSDEVPNLVRTIVKREWKSLNVLFRKEYGSIKKIYEMVRNFDSYERQDLSWLPKYEKVDDYLTQKRTKEVLPQLHVKLQKYAVAIHYLSTLDIQTDANFNWNKRNRILHNLSRQLKSVLCETETAVNATCQIIPERIPTSFPDSQGLSSTLDLTGMYLQDWSVLSKLKEFIEGWNRNIRVLYPSRTRKVSEMDSTETETESDY